MIGDNPNGEYDYVVTLLNAHTYKAVPASDPLTANNRLHPGVFIDTY